MVYQLQCGYTIKLTIPSNTIYRPHVPELDYVAHLTLELYERSIGSAHREKEYSIRLALSGGAHTSNVLDSQLDAKHSLNVQPRRQLTHHLDYDYAIQMLSRHFDKDWVFSTTPLEGDALYGIKPDHIEQIREVRLNGGASTPKKYLESGTDDGASTKSSNNSHSSH